MSLSQTLAHDSRAPTCFAAPLTARKSARARAHSCVVDGVVMPELNETVGDGGDGDDSAIPRAGEVFVDSVAAAKDR